jgi:hypothetical protein
MLAIAYLIRLLSWRTRTVLLAIDEHGILDFRLMSKRIEWNEIGAICSVVAPPN